MSTAMTALPVKNPLTSTRSLRLGIGTTIGISASAGTMRMHVRLRRGRSASSAASRSSVNEKDSKMEEMDTQDEAPSPPGNANAEARHGSSSSKTMSTTGLTGSARLFADASVEESQTSVSLSTSTSSEDRSFVSSDSNKVLSPDAGSSIAGGTDAPGLTGSAKLFADAIAEESYSFHSSSSSSSNRIAQLIHEGTQKDDNWTGDERVQDTVLRMLVDKYKPLRGPVIRSAEEKLKERPPSVASSDWFGRATEPLLPSVEGHRPWHTTFTPPSTLAPRVKVGSFSPPSSSRKVVMGGESGGPKQDVAATRRNATAQRLGRAKESMIDYKLGVHPTRSSMEPRRPPPVSLKAWSNLIEERIERARLEGQFKTLKGRGKPIKRESEETNPFIAREEFLMNRIVQRNQAAPAWVELQNEVENAIQTFRTILHQTWTRRAILILTSNRSLSALSTLTLSDIRALRDPGWVARESSYHTSALQEVNEVVRRYNGVAPYAVRKAYFVREKELERLYWESGEDVLRGVRERVRKGSIGRRTAGVGESEDGDGGGGGGYEGEKGSREEKRIGIWEMVRTWIASLRAG